ncbi:alpha/beta fold hydrolase [Gramella jeungdoensis]|uniref:Alpha/beta fold hydrolase n=1 Tax=Gramella jeungdoensis TaxID=708091 RepID=A0ABT0Z1C5_9FLAO|nr:alpha/beta fold hydrolase [Gramella jeungdoensis]MCM8568604.1 alpha/beta fold hydrolase [Gramella jeungdoensis]
MQTGRTNYARSGGVNIAYQEFGSGDTCLIVVPGWISNVEQFTSIPPLAAWVNHLSGFCRLILFDKRGTGLSDRVNESELPGMDQRAEDLLAVMEHAKIDRAAFFGLSEGGPLGIHFTATYPEKVSKLILFGSFAKWVRSEDYPYGLNEEGHLKTINYMAENWGGPVGLQLMAPSVKDDPEAQQYWASYLRHSASPSAAIALYRMNLDIDVRHCLKKIKKPVLLIHREGDKLVECGHSKFLKENIEGAKLLLTKGADHLPWFGINREELMAMQTFLLDGNVVSDKRLDKLNPEDIFAIYSIKDHIEKHFEEEITINSLSRQFGINDFKVKSGFKALFATPVINFLNQTRLNYSLRLLSDPRLTMSDIAEKVGYKHPNNFSTAFKRRYGVPPNKYRGELMQGKDPKQKKAF